jgi:hypothetical protein
VGDIGTLGHSLVGSDVEFHFDYLFLLVVPYYNILRGVCQGVLGKKLKNILFINCLQKMMELFTFKNFGPCSRSRPTKKKDPEELPSGMLSPQMIECVADVVVEVLTAIADIVVEVGKNLACAVVNEVAFEVAIFKSRLVGVEQFADVIALDTECGSDFLKTKFEVKHFIFSFLLGFVPPFVIILYHIWGDLSRVFSKFF